MTSLRNRFLCCIFVPNGIPFITGLSIARFAVESYAFFKIDTLEPIAAIKILLAVKTKCDTFLLE